MPNPPTWRARLSLFVWVITLDLSGTGGPTSSIRYYQHSSRDQIATQATPLLQSIDTFGGERGTDGQYLTKPANHEAPHYAVYCLNF